MNRLRQLQGAGVSIWLDDLSRELLESGEFRRLIQGFAVTGATSNPTIFAKAITGSDRYDDQLQALLASGTRDLQEIFFALALEDVRQAADLLRPVYAVSDGWDGFVSFECTPDLADDAQSTVEQAIAVRDRLDRPNVLIKVAATDAGIEAIEELTARGVSVNVTLLFSLSRYEQAIDAYLDGLERRAAAGEPLAGITSVASFFVSRVDAAVDPQLEPGLAPARTDRDRKRPASLRPLPGNAWNLAVEATRGARSPAAAAALGQRRDQGRLLLGRSLRPGAGRPARHQHDATEDAACVCQSRGHRQLSWVATPASPSGLIGQLAASGVDFVALTDGLERQGVEAFRDSYRQLLSSIEERIASLTAEVPGGLVGHGVGS